MHEKDTRVGEMYLSVREVECAATRGRRARASSFLLPTFAELDSCPRGARRRGLDLVHP